MQMLSEMPWVSSVIWTIVTLAGAWGVGYLLEAVVLGKLASWSTRAGSSWGEHAIGVLRKRIPRWCVLVGAWLSTSYWPFSTQGQVFVSSAVFVVAVGSITFAAAALAARLIVAYGARITPTVAVTTLSQNIAWLTVCAFGALVILNGLGVSITPMITALGIGGLAVAMALQDPLANLFAGLFLSLSGQIRVGDYVKLDSNVEGFIADFSWRATRIRMLANNVVLVPNAKLAQAIVTNFYQPSPDMAVLVELGVDYGSDLERVERVVCEVAREVMADVTGGVPEFAPFVRYHTFGESSVNFTVILRGKEFTDQYLVKHEFVKRLHMRFHREGIVIPFPMRTLVVRDAMPVAVSVSGASAFRPM